MAEQQAQPGTPGAAGVTEAEAYRMFADALTDITLMVFGTDLRYLLVAGAGVTRYGWDREAIVGRRPTQILGHDAGEPVEQAMARALAGETWEFKHPGIHDPQAVWSNTFTPVRSRDGTIVAGFAISREVSGVLAAERARRETEQRFEVALEAAPIFVFAQDESLRYTWANKTIVNPSPQAILGRTDNEILPTETAAVLTEAKQRVLATGMGTRLVVGVDASGAPGARRYFDITLEPARDEDGSVIGVVGAATDVSELKASEQRLEAALEAVPDSVTIQQPVRDRAGAIVDFRITYATTDAVDFAGRGRADLVGRTIMDLYPPLRGSGFLESYRQVLRTGRRFQLESMPYTQHGVTRHYDLVATRISDAELMVLWRDVTGRQAQRDAAARADAARAIGEELQRVLLPSAIPHVPGLEFSVAYRPANATAEVGGDWYDVVVVPDSNAVVVVVGDVEGHDGRAAAVMGRVSSVIRAEASRDERPSAILDLAERFLLDLGVERMATVAVARICRATGEIVLASAGHPPPLLGDGDMVSVLSGEVGPPLGAGPAPRTERHGRLAPGGVMLMYTDGLLAPRMPFDEATDGLATCLARVTAHAPLDKLISEVIQPTEHFDPSDDVAVLVMRRIAALPG